MSAESKDRWRPGARVLPLVHGALLAGAAFLFHDKYARMPARVPIHWNLRGEADGFGSPQGLWLFLVSMGVVFGLSLLVATPWTRGQLAPQAGDREEDREVREHLLRLNVRLGQVSLLLANAALCYLWLVIADAALEQSAGGLMGRVALGVAGVLSGALAPTLVYGPRIVRARRQLERRAGDDGRSREDRWAAGLVYYAPEDPAIWVPKRFGMGYTLNFGNPRAWLMLAALLSPPLIMATLFNLFGR